jgi:phage host-nuclease inhibitor protein Gam
MAEVINDVEALAEFRAHLMQFNAELAESFAAIRSHWLELGDLWRDDMYRLFGEALEEVTPGIESYLSSTEGLHAHLATLIEQLQAYLDAGLAVGQRDRRDQRRR